MAQSVVVVTGALTGIGEATAKAFAQRGRELDLLGLFQCGSRADAIHQIAAQRLTDGHHRKRGDCGLRRGTQGRAGRPDEVAEAIQFLSGAQSAYLTGQALFLDGGVTVG